MNTRIDYSAPNLTEMKKTIVDIGGMFYQYRPCRRNAATIYDIENIRHGVVYAQTPLNMNDPFDSMMGFSAEDIYNEIITMLLNAIEMDENTKTIITFLLCHRAFGKLAELITSAKDLKSYLSPTCAGVTIVHTRHAVSVYRKMPRLPSVLTGVLNSCVNVNTSSTDWNMS